MTFLRKICFDFIVLKRCQGMEDVCFLNVWAFIAGGFLKQQARPANVMFKLRNICYEIKTMRWYLHILGYTNFLEPCYRNYSPFHSDVWNSNRTSFVFYLANFAIFSFVYGEVDTKVGNMILGKLKSGYCPILLQ